MTCPASQPAISPTTIHARNPMFVLLGSAPGRPTCTIYPRRLAMIQLGFSAPEPFQGPRVANGLFKVEAGSLITVENRPTRTLSEPDGICSSGVGQHPATALAPPLGRSRDDHRWSPPAQIRTSAFTHTALMKDDWRRSEIEDKGAGL